MGNGTKGPVTATAAGIKQVLAKLSGIQNLIEQERSTYSVSEFEVIQGYAKISLINTFNNGEKINFDFRSQKNVPKFFNWIFRSYSS